MNLQTIGHLIAERRRAKGLTLTQLATEAAVGRSTLAALEAGKLPELGLERVARLCAAVDFVLEARPLELDQPLMAHRHLSRWPAASSPRPLSTTSSPGAPSVPGANSFKR